MRLYVGNLPYSMNQDELVKAFEAYGANSASIPTDPDGRSKGFGFVDIENDAEAERAINDLNGKEMGGRALTVNQARPRVERPQR